MKIVFCIDSPGFGGSEINAMKLIFFLKQFHTISLLINNDASVELKNFIKQNDLPYNSFYSPTHSSYILKGLWKGWQQIRVNKAELFIIWSHHIDSNRWLQVALAILKKRFIVVEQMLPVVYSGVLKISKLSIPLKKFIVKRAFTSIICAYSQVPNYSHYLKSNNITVIPNSRPVKKIAESVSILRNKNKVNTEFLIVCCVGRLTDQKDQPSLLRAVALLKTAKKVRLILAGDGEDRGELEELIRQLSLKDVQITGFIKDVLPILASSDIFVLPSIGEGLPGSLIEAMAAGLPCIATDIPGNNELVIHKSTGLLVPVNSPESIAEALHFYIENPEVAKEFAENGYRHVLKNYDESVEFGKWKSLLGSIG